MAVALSQRLELLTSDCRPQAVSASNCVGRPPAFRGFGRAKRGRGQDLERNVVAFRCGRLELQRFNRSFVNDSRQLRSDSLKYLLERKLSLHVRWQKTCGQDFWPGFHSSRLGKMMIVCAEKATGISDGRAEQQGKPKLDATDMMELEFGRLLGEDRQTTLAKVVGKKFNPQMSYIKMEKQRELKESVRVELSTRLKKNPRQVMQGIATGRGASEVASPVVRPGRGAERVNQTNTGEDVVPELASPPVRPKGAEQQITLPLRTIRVVPPVKFGGKKKSRVEDLNDVGLSRKPMRGPPSEIGLPPPLPVADIISPMLMRTKLKFVTEDKQSSFNDASLRRPATLSPTSSPVSSARLPSSTSLNSEGSEVESDVDSVKLTERRNEQGLEGEESFHLGSEAPALQTVPGTSSVKSSVAKPVPLNLNRKPIVSGKASSSVAQEPSLQETGEKEDSAVKEVERTARSAGFPSPAVKFNPTSHIPESLSNVGGTKVPELNISSENAGGDLEELMSTVSALQEVGMDEETTVNEEAARAVSKEGELNVARMRPMSMPDFVTPLPDRVTESTPESPNITVRETTQSFPAVNQLNTYSNPSERTAKELATEHLVSKEVRVSPMPKPGMKLPVSDGAAMAAFEKLESISEGTPSIFDAQQPKTLTNRSPPATSVSDPLFARVRLTPQPQRVAPLADGQSSTTENTDVSSDATVLSVVVPEQSQMYTDQTTGTNLELDDLDSNKFIDKKVKSGSLQDFVVRSQDENQPNLDRGPQNKDELGMKDDKVEADVVTQTWGQTVARQLQENRKSMTISQPLPGPTPLKLPSVRAKLDMKPVQPNDVLQQKLEKASSIQQDMSEINKEEEDKDWARVTALRDSKFVEEVTIIGNARGGLLASFGSLTGYLPAFELSARKKHQSSLTGSQTSGFDDSRKGLAQIDQEGGTNDFAIKQTVANPIVESTQKSQLVMGEQKSSEIKPFLELHKKDQMNFESLLTGEKGKVIVTAVDRKLRQLRFSQKQADAEDREGKKKAKLMESLSVGDVITCHVKRMTTFGAFVEVQGISALIHRSELTWNQNIDPFSVLQVGEEVKVKVFKLDRFLWRINLSLKRMQPDPLLETLESLVSSIQAPDESDTEAEPISQLNSVLTKLAASPGISAVVLGHSVRGSALAPAFQVFLSGWLDGGYKLLARSGNEVQEVLVETTISREQMKELIQECMVQDS